MGLVLVWSAVASAQTAPTAATTDTKTDRGQTGIGQPWKRSPSVASDDAVRAQARTHAAAAFTSLDNGNMAEAVTHFTEALDLVDAPTLRVGRADALVRLGKWVAAKADYQAAMAYTIGPQDSASFSESQTDAKSKLEALDQRMPHLRVNTAVKIVEIAVDDASPKQLAATDLLDLDPGSHQVVVSASGSSVTHSVQAREREDVVVDGPAPPVAEPKESSPAPAAVAPAQPLEDSGNGPTTEFVVSASITGALAIGTVITGALFLSARSEYSKVRDAQSASPEREQQLYDRANTLGWVNTGLLAATVVGAGVSTYFWLAPRFDRTPAKNSTVPASGLGQLTPSGVWFGVSGQF